MEQEILQQILDEIKEMKADIKKLDVKIDTTEKHLTTDVNKIERGLASRIDKVERHLVDEINLQGRYILEDVEKVSNKLDNVIDKNKLLV